MENKFYTPKIEEFHQGFEYEYSYKGNPFVKENYTLCSGIDEFAGDHYSFAPQNPDTVCRVKHLDQEDIESLGWKYRNKDDTPTITFTKPYSHGVRTFAKESHLVFSPVTRWLYIAIGDDETSFSDWDTRFQGTIKNKSELQKIMKQIGI